jgi:bifunctional DNA-binding transcriptional regulator/antitoxin component of YhaV-PrlF toxin-antitoxin module
MIELTPENTSRKLDNLGRIVIPKGLRTRLGFNESDDLYFYTMSQDGISYICLTNCQTEDPKYRTAVSVLEELGIDIPDELLEKIN